MKTVYRLGTIYFDITKIKSMSELYINEQDDDRCYCRINIDGKIYDEQNYYCSEYGSVIANDKLENSYQRFKTDAQKLLSAFISR